MNYKCKIQTFCVYDEKIVNIIVYIDTTVKQMLGFYQSMGKENM